MNRKTLILIISGIIVLLAGIVLVSRPHSQLTPANDGQEPEGEILNMVQFSGEAKLKALLAPPQVSAANNELSTYILSNVGSYVHTATVDGTTLQNDGSIALDVSAGGKSFSAVIYSGADQFTFKVPAANYQTSTPQSIIENQYSGGGGD